MAWQFIRRRLWPAVFGLIAIVVVYSMIRVYMQGQFELRVAQELQAVGFRVRLNYTGPKWLPASYRSWFYNQIGGIGCTSKLFERGNFESTEFKNLNFENLAALKRVEFVDFHGIPLTDDHIRRLKGLRAIGLQLWHTQITDAGLQYLRTMPNLELLDVGATKVTDRGLEVLKEIQSLEFLILSDLSLSDAGLEHLKALNRLTNLDISLTDIGDQGLNSLKGLSNLKELNLEATQTTIEGRAALREALPNCKITPNP